MGAKLFFIALNEFDEDMLKEYSFNLNLMAIQELISLERYSLKISDNTESDFLEPWCQWNSIFSGKKASDHGVKRFGQKIKSVKYIWQEIDKLEKSSSVMGAISSCRGELKNNIFFLPDPWNYIEKAYPAKYQSIHDFARYRVQNRTEVSIYKMIFLFLRAFPFFFDLKFFGNYKKIFYTVVSEILRVGFKEYILFALYEYCVALVYLDKIRENVSDLNVIFLNSIAHVQHHHWRENSKQELCFALKIVNEILSEVIEIRAKSGAEIILCNGLTQENIEKKRKEYLYRPKSYEKFLKLLNINCRDVSPLMSNDAILFFYNKFDLGLGKKEIEQITIKGKKVFFTEEDEEGLTLFIRFEMFEEIENNEKVLIGNKKICFGDFFSKIMLRSGAHKNEALIFSSLNLHADGLETFEIYEKIKEVIIGGSLKCP